MPPKIQAADPRRQISRAPSRLRPSQLVFVADQHDAALRGHRIHQFGHQRHNPPWRLRPRRPGPPAADWMRGAGNRASWESAAAGGARCGNFRRIGRHLADSQPRPRPSQSFREGARRPIPVGAANRVRQRPLRMNFASTSSRRAMVKVLPVPGPPSDDAETLQAGYRRGQALAVILHPARPAAEKPAAIHPQSAEVDFTGAGFHRDANGQGQPVFIFPSTDKGRAANDRPGSSGRPWPGVPTAEKRAAPPPRVPSAGQTASGMPRRGSTRARPAVRERSRHTSPLPARAAEQGGGELHGRRFQRDERLR